MAGEIEDAIERADRESFTKEPPKTLKGQIGFLIKQFGSAKAVAAELGTTADSVNRYRRGARWQPLVRKRRQKQAATTGGITVETRARFGYTAPVGTTDDGRFRRLTVHLPLTPAACSTPATRGPATSRCAGTDGTPRINGEASWVKACGWRLRKARCPKTRPIPRTCARAVMRSGS